MELRAGRRQAVVAPHAVPAGFDETGAAQMGEVTGHGGLGQLEGPDDVPNTDLFGSQQVKEPEPRLVGERAEHGVGGCGIHKASIRWAHRRGRESSVRQHPANELPTVLYVCVHNAGRSQMAAAVTEALGAGAVKVLSAGSAPADALHPHVRAVLEEAGLDVSAARPKRLTEGAVLMADVVVTMGCGDACPVFPGKRYEDWKLDDPAGQDLDAVRAVFAEIQRRVRGLLADLCVDPAS